VRLGICLGLIKGVHLNEITRLFFLIQRFHVQALLAGRLLSADDRKVETFRSGLVRKTLKCASFEEGADV
jgi:protein-arginine kinase